MLRGLHLETFVRATFHMVGHPADVVDADANLMLEKFVRTAFHLISLSSNDVQRPHCDL